MPRTAFFAELRDLDDLISYVIKENIGEIYETISDIDKSIKKINDVKDAHAMGVGSPANKNDLLLLQIVPKIGEKWSYLRKNELNINGHKGVRTSIEGYSLIQFYLGGVVAGSNSILESTIGVGTAAEFKKRAVTEEDIRNIEEVDWDGVKAAYNTIVKFIKANSDGKKRDDAYVMNGGRKLLDNGYKMVSAF